MPSRIVESEDLTVNGETPRPAQPTDTNSHHSTAPGIKTSLRHANINRDPLLNESRAADVGLSNRGTNGHDIINTDTDRLEPIAVIGLDLTFPQDATSTESFWKLLMESRSAMTDVPKDRFNLDGFHGLCASGKDMLGVRGGHFLKEDIATFDAPFFAVTPEEAASMDPQQRLLLESTYKALENAGITLGQVHSTRTSVHIGCFMHDYELMLARDPEFPIKYKSTGTGASMLANKISWFYNFYGISVTLDTACSSSLVALHLACQDVRSGHSRMGIVAGCNLIFNPETSVGLEEMNFLSPDGKCYSFDHRANGYSRGEGIGIVIVKLLSDAITDGDTIRAVIRNTGCNQDGRTPGITQPSSKAQEQLIRQTYEDAGLDLAKTRYFESHGTGTVLGDALEVQAIHSVFGNVRPIGCPIYIGAVKSNIGHLEGTSGIAGLIKSILVLEKGVIPPNIWYEKPNPRIRTTEWSIAFPTKAISWPETGLRRASVSSFGFGGSNAHVVLDDARHFLQLRGLRGLHRTSTSTSLLCYEVDGSSSTDHTINRVAKVSHFTQQYRKLLVWSSTEESGIDRLTTAYRDYIIDSAGTAGTESDSFLDDLAFTLSEKRTRFPWRSYAIVSSMEQLPPDFKLPTPTRSTKTPKVCFVFTGQGAQWYAMGRGLSHYSVYRGSLEKADGYLHSLGCDWSLLGELEHENDKSSRLSDPLFSQPICTALQIALLDLLASWGIMPSVVVGHSSGEIAAAYCAGGISRESALRIAYYRGLVSASTARQARTQPQGMMAVGLSVPDIAAIIDSHELRDDISIAAVNSPQSVTLSGSINHLKKIFATLQHSGVFCRYLKTDVAYHSRYMEDAVFLYRRLTFNIEAGNASSTPGLPIMVSTVTGNVISSTALTDVTYWIDNMVSTVQFSEAVSRICTSPKEINGKAGEATVSSVSSDYFLEIGPHSTLQSPIKEILRHCGRVKDIAYGSILVRSKDAGATALEAAARLFCLGTPIDIMAVNSPSGQSRKGKMLINLPSYPFNHTKQHWLESRVSKNFRSRKIPHHDLLGTQHADWNSLEAVWSNRIILSDKSFIRDHKVDGLDVYPAAGMLVMAIEAARQTTDGTSNISGYRFRDIVFRKALVVSEGPEGIETRFYLRPMKDMDAKAHSWNEFRLCVYENETWSENCRGAIAVEFYGVSNDFRKLDLEEKNHIVEACQAGIKQCTNDMEAPHLYKFFSNLGLTYGPAFQSSQSIKFGRHGESTAYIDAQNWRKYYSMQNQPHVIHPTTLDAVFQLSYPAITRGGKVPVPTMVPTAIKALWISNEQMGGKDINAYVSGGLTGLRNASVSILGISADQNGPRITGDLEMTFISEIHKSSSSGSNHEQRYYNMDWKADVNLLAKNALGSFCTNHDSHPTPLPEILGEEKEMLCYTIMQQALQTVSEGGLPPESHLRKYWQWMQRQVSANKNKYIEAYDGLPSINDRVRLSGPEGALICRVQENLIGVLRGEIDPLQMLFVDTLLEDYYRLSHDAPFVLGRAMTYIDALAHKNPGLKVLEIGAGTGSLTTYAIDALLRHGEKETGSPRFSEYVFTDISPSFFGHAKEKFRLDRMNFKVLDIERDPEHQGFEAGQYDLVLASNVLHATASLETTLKHTRKLLKPGGKLILYEMTSPQLMRIGFIFGLLPGWWRSVESNREWGPLSTIDEWQGLLNGSQFSGIDVALSNSVEKGDGVCSALISTALPEQEIRPLAAVSLIIDKSSTLQTSIAKRLEAHLGLFGCEKLETLGIDDLASLDWSETTCVSLLDLDTSVLSRPREDRLRSLQALIRNSNGLLWVTRRGSESHIGPANAMASGLARVVRSERETFRFVILELADPCDDFEVVDCATNVLQRMIDEPLGECETEYVYQDGRLCISRVVEDIVGTGFTASSSTLEPLEIVRLGNLPKTPLKLAIGSIGLLDTLHFTKDSQFRDKPTHDEIEIEVKAVGLNFRDILIALGQVQSDSFGTECAGIVTALGKNTATRFAIGDRVICGSKGAFTTLGRYSATTVIKIPDALSFKSAAALPTVYCTAYYCLNHWARLKNGESILVHSGAGGFGQAIIQLAKLSNAEIYTTVGSQEKRDFLINTYGIPKDHIFYSRTLSFASAIKRMTNQRGVDVVINSLTGEGLRSSWECIAPFGRFIEVGRKDIYAPGISPMGGLSMYQFSKNVMFASVDLVFIMETDKGLMQDLMSKVIKLVTDGKITTSKPLHVFSAAEMEKAFRFMQSGTHTGKIVIEFNKDDVVPIVRGPNLDLFDPETTYVIAGGLGGLGQSIARWMIDRNARNLILLSRSQTHTESVKNFLEDLRTEGARVAVPPCDIADREALSIALQECLDDMPPIKGCIQSAMILENVLFDEMTTERWHKAVSPKVDGTWNLHELLPKGMDFFIMLSSCTGIVGVVGQANYAAGNTYQDALARFRVSQGEKATAIDLGAITNVGYVAQNARLAVLMHAVGHESITDSEIHSLLEYYCNRNLPVLSPLKSQIITSLALPATLRTNDFPEFPWMSQPMFRHLHQIAPAGSDGSSSVGKQNATGSGADLSVALGSATNLEEAAEVVCDSLRDKLSKMLAMVKADIEAEQPPHMYGVDSLVAMEVRNWFAKAIVADVAVFEILGDESMRKLAREVARRSQMVREEVKREG